MKIALWVKVIWIVIAVSLISLLFKPIKPVSVTAQSEITILRKAEKAVDSLSLFIYRQQDQDKARSLAILAIAEQLKRIADALERK